ncbi:MAG: bifunctional phosphopantothenoylcysteine decarboxylase/phosphopantothenate--cysteine ligase CoaBC [Candidatus Diapherotrites archaeon]|nr:bifunctional phosphopantothenoylcysteine decarboxylase/phosphopantothenate--cysteine ligase CoaBC [Candidatus Diapherotrites archaeon]
MIPIPLIDCVKSGRLKGRKVVLCVTGSVAAVRAPEIARELRRHGAGVYPFMSDGALGIITEDVMEWACEREVVTRLTGKVEHVRAAYADVVLVCPATANTISKVACGIDDTPVTSAVSCALGNGVPVVVVPAMHGSMYAHPFVSENLQKLREHGVVVLSPRLEESKAKVAETDEVVDTVISALTPKTLEGKRLVITAGPTFERIDAVRGVTNMSSGRMGVELAREALRRGAEVTLVYGPGTAAPVGDVMRVESAKEMICASLKALEGADALISAAAIADYSVANPREGKVDSSGPLPVSFVRSEKLVRLAKERYPGKLVVAFKLEKDDVVGEARKKLVEDNLDLVVANDLSAVGSVDNHVWIVCREGISEFSGSKSDVASFVLDAIAKAL